MLAEADIKSAGEIAESAIKSARMSAALANAPKPEIVWRPLPGSQSIAIDSRCDHTLYEGARGPGKTVTQLMRFLRHVGKGYGQFWRGVIFDLEFDHLGGLVAESKNGSASSATVRSSTNRLRLINGFGLLAKNCCFATSKRFRTTKASTATNTRLSVGTN